MPPRQRFPSGRFARSRTALTAVAAVVGAATAAIAASPAQAAPMSTPQMIAQRMIPDAGQFTAFSDVVSHESGWNPRAVNPSSGAYGIGQALPATSMASAGPHWRTDAATQIKWTLNYMNSRYGSPEAAWAFWQQHHWY
ncbi:transglycosylase SLT domain-containing protein [Streptomyces sp. NPDC090021]|uniref:aggregation-promoting factor C-terminal-like domain-containing protein n=1 Tax=Streptomyces sp. NPDC090021 TaxID=3365919 RepID=UPI0038232F57